MRNNDLEFIYEQLKGKYDLLLTTTFALDEGYTIDVPVLCGSSVLGRFELYKEDDDCEEFVLTVEFATPKKAKMATLMGTGHPLASAIPGRGHGRYKCLHGRYP